MTKPVKSVVTSDGWSHLKKYTSARIAIGRSGGSLPTSEWLNFKLSHARAKDAVHLDFDPVHLAGAIQAAGCETLVVRTCATDRKSYLQRPDLGRRLSEESKSMLIRHSADYDLVIIVSDGLSSMAADRQILPLFENLLPKLRGQQWKLAPIIVAPFARVALQDEVGFLLNARIALILLGERPGLGSPDSLGAYLVFGPKTGNTDAQRNCVSNIRPQGLGFSEATDTLCYLIGQARIQKLSGILLKDQRNGSEIEDAGVQSAKHLPDMDDGF